MSKRVAAAAVFLGILGCRPAGLPPEPPEEDAANPEAKIPKFELPKDPFLGSAFDGEKLPEGGGHDHHKHHGGHGK